MAAEEKSNILPFRGKVHPDNAVTPAGIPMPKSTSSLTDPRASETARALEQIHNEVDPTKFYHRSSDKRGHSVSVTIRIPKHWLGVLEHIKERVPAYKTTTDVFRDGFIHRVVWMDKNADSMDSHEMSVFKMDIIAEKSIADRATYNKTRVNMGKSLQDAIKVKDWHEAIDLLQQYKGEAEEMREFYRVRVMQMLAKYEKRVIDGRRDREDREE